MNQELEFVIRTTEPSNRIYIDKLHDEVFLSLAHRHGTAHVKMTVEQAKDLIGGLIRIVEAMEKTEA